MLYRNLNFWQAVSLTLKNYYRLHWRSVPVFLDIDLTSDPANKFPGDFQDTFNKFPVIFYTDQASLVLQLYVQKLTQT